MWTEKTSRRWERHDGAVVKYSEMTIYSNPLYESARMWIAFKPDPSTEYLARGRRDSRLRWPRRFKTPQAAMKAVDKECPPTTPENSPKST